jgi:hypothetical protein
MSDFFNFDTSDNVFNNLMSDDLSIQEDKAIVTGEAEPSDIDPPAKKPGALSRMIDKTNKDFFNSLSTPSPMTSQSLKGSAIKTVSPDYVEKFKAQEGYDALNFNPYATETNTQRAIENETWASALSKGFDSFLYNAGNTYTSWFSDYGKMADAISSGDWDAIKPSENELISQYYLDQKNANKNYVFVPEEDEDGIFNKKFFADFLGNVGFTYGTISAISTELAADVLITGLTGGAGFETFGLTLARGASKLGTKFGIKQATKEGVELAAKRNFFSGVGRGISLADKPLEAIKPIVREATEAELIASSRIVTATGREIFDSYLKIFSNNILNIAKSKSAGEFAKNILKGTPLIGTGIGVGEKIGIAARAGATGGELLGMGAQGLRRVAQELNMSISEASFESVSSYGDTLDMMIKNHQDSHGGDLPNAEEFNKMREYAVQASSSNYDTNTAILLATNKLQFGNLFGKFIPANAAMHAIESTMAENTVAAIGKKGVFKIFDKSGFFGTFGILGQVKSEFGKKEAAKLLGKSFLRNSLSFEIAEGAQEIYQEASAVAWKNYYADKYGNNTKGTLSEYFGQGFKDQWSKQGLKTFLTGALTGMLVKGPSKIMNRVVEKSQETYYNNKYKTNPSENPFNKAKERLKSDIQMVNSVFKAGGPNAFSNKVVNFNQQVVSAMSMSEAASKGLQYEFKNSKDNALLAAVMSAHRTNTIKGFTNAIKEMGVDFSAEDFKKEFNIDIADTEYKTPQEFTEKVANDLTKYTKIIDDVTRGVKNRMIDVNDYIPGTADRIVANHARKAQEEAISIIALNAIKTDMTTERIKDLTQDLSKISGLENSSDYAMRVLSDPIFLENEIKTVGYQIKQLKVTLKEGVTGSVKADVEKELKAAEKEEELLNSWKALWKQRSEISNNPEDTENVFVGKVINKKQRVLNAEGKKLWTPVETYDVKHKEVVKLFKQLIDIKNKQSGIDSELSQTSLNQGFEKIVDYIRLSRDNKDYMQAVEVLSNPEKFMSMHKKSTEGLYKYNIEDFFNNINRSILEASKIIANNVSDDPEEIVSIALDIANTIIEKIKESEAYNSLVAIVTDPTLGIETAKESEKYINKIQSIISLELHKVIKKYSPEEIGLDIKEAELNEILTSKELSDFRLLSIAEKLMNNIELLPNEKKALEDPVIQMNVDMKVAELKYVGYTPAVQVVENEDGSADVVDTTTGEKINQEPLTTEQAEDLKSKVDSLPTAEVLNAEVQTPAPPVKVENDDEYAQATNYEDQSDFDLLNSFTTASDANKIATLEALREYNSEYKALKIQFGKQLISKDQYQAELDKINAKIYVPGAEKITLKSLLDKNKVVTEPGANNAPNAPQQPTQQPVSDIDAKKAELEDIARSITNKLNIRNNDTVVRKAINDSNKRLITLEQLDAAFEKWNNENGLNELLIKQDVLKEELAALEGKPAEPVVDMQQAEELVREMVKPNGKKITDFTNDEQKLISTVSVERKQEIQAEEAKLAEEKENAKIKEDPDYVDFGDDGDTGEDVSTLFGDKTAEKLKMVKQNRDFAAEYLGTEDESKIIEFITRANILLQNLNEEKGSNLESLKMLSSLKATKEKMMAIRDNIMKPEISEEEEEEDEDFGTDAEDILKAMRGEVQEKSTLSVNQESSDGVQNIDIQSILEDYKQAKVDNSKKSSKFVEKGDQSLLDQINDINDEPGC